MSDKTTVVEETAVTTTAGTAVATQHANRGFEGVAPDSVKMPIARVLQPISKEVADESYAEYNFKAGNIIHSLLLEKLSEAFIPLTMKDDKICFVPKQDAEKAQLVSVVKNRFGTVLTDDDMKMGFVCRSYDNVTGTRFGKCSECKLCEFDGNQAPFCNKNINVLALFESHELPLVIRFSSTSHKHGTAFKNLAYFSGGDLFSRMYKTAIVKKTDKGNVWYELTIKPAGKCSPEAYAQALEMYEKFKGLVIVTEEAAEEPAAGTAETRF